MGEGVWTGDVVITSNLDPSVSATIPVSVTVVRAIGDLLVISPSIIDTVVAAEGAGLQTFPIQIKNADSDRTSFNWSAETTAEWLSLSQSSGTGNGTISLTVNPAKLMLTGTGGAAATGTITFRSNLTQDMQTLTVNVSVVQSTALSASPSQLYWSVEKDPAGGTLTFDPQSIQVFAGAAGWSATYSASFLSVAAFAADGTALGVLASNNPYGHLEVTPVASALQSLGYGRHQASITVSDRLNQFSRQIPVIIDILHPGEMASIPLPDPEFYQIDPSYIMIETNDASRLYFQMQAPRSTTQKVYVLIELPQLLPGQVYALTNKVAGGLALAYQNGLMVDGANNYSYADGPVPTVPIGPFQLQGLSGTAVFTMKTGSSLSSSTEVQRAQVNIRTLAGDWRVTENFAGESYAYTDPYFYLTLAQNAGLTTYSGTWGPSAVTVTPGDGRSFLYRLNFSENGFNYIYEILNLTGNEMSGRYSFAWDGAASGWETFFAQRVVGPFR
jgi:hypothetical protein